MNIFSRKSASNKQVHRPAEGLRWGPAVIDHEEATGHFLAVGSTGSGKTTILRLLIQSALKDVGVNRDRRALMYDAKQDLLPLLAAICPRARVVTSHPFDARSARWDMSRDIQDPAVAIEIAFTLIPHDGDSQPFFPNAARHLLYGVTLSLMLSEEPWTFGTLVRVMKHPKRIRSVLRTHPQTRDIISQYFYDERLLMNIMSTIATKMLAFEPIAAAWDQAKQTFSINDWVTGDWILVLGNYETGRTAIDAINRCIFKRACDLTLNLPNSDTRRSWFIIDELSEAGGRNSGGLPGLVPLAKKGRSKGAALAIAFQSVSGLRDPNVFGQYLADEVLGQIAHRFFGRLECVATAEWASSLFGDEESDKESVTTSDGAGGRSQSVSRQTTTRRLVMPGELMTIEGCNRRNGLSGYYIVRSEGAFFDCLPGEQLFDHDLVPPSATEPEFVPRPPADQYLAPWTDEDRRRYAAEVKRSPKDRVNAPKSQADANRPATSADKWNDLDAAFG